jgi:predicted deacylase
MIPLFVEGTMNVLKHHGIITGPMGRTGRDTDVFVANSGHIVLATHGGFVELLVELNDKVQTGQKVAIQRNAFGEVVAEYTSEVAGEIAVRRTEHALLSALVQLTATTTDDLRLLQQR